MLSISDDFADPLGRWNYYDTDVTLLDELKARKHTNIRSFYSDMAERQLSMLELSQPVGDLGPTMNDLESDIVAGLETWSKGTAGPDPALNNRNSLRIDVAAGASVTAISTLDQRLDLTSYVAGDRLSMSCPNFPGASLDLSGCSLKLKQGELSITLPFPLDAATNGNREIAWPVEALGQIFTPNEVTLTLKATAACTVTFAALRMLAAEWTPTALDTDTITERLRAIVDVDGSYPSTPFTKVWRAADPPGEDDPRPIDSRLTVAFFSGSLTQGNRISLYMRGRREDFLTQLDLDGTDAGIVPRWGEDQDSLDARKRQPDYGQAVYNPRPQIDLDRETQRTLDDDWQVEIERLPDTISEAWIEVNLYFGAINLVTVETTETLLDDEAGYSFPIPHLTPRTNYLFGVDLEDNELQVTIYELDDVGAIGDKVFDSARFGDTFLFLRSKGRIGWECNFSDGDVYLESIRSRGLMFGEVRTNNLESFTPVDGARLVVGATLDREVIPPELVPGGPPNPDLVYNGAILDLDLYNSKSKNGAIKVAAKNLQGIQSPLLVFEDFAHSYVSFDVFYPSSALALGFELQALLVNKFDSATSLTMPLLKGDQWQTVRLRLTRAIFEQSGQYRLRLLQDGDPTTFWIDNFKVVFQSVAWSGRATYEDPWKRGGNRWTEFQTFINSEDDGIVFPERGRWTQVRGQTLTPEATIDKVYVRPKYSQLGRLVGEKPKLGPPNRIAIGVSPEGSIVPEDTGVVPMRYHDAGIPLVFEAQVDGDAPISQWHWDFGDGTESTLQNPTHTYVLGSPDTIVHLQMTDVYGREVNTSLNLMLSADGGTSMIVHNGVTYIEAVDIKFPVSGDQFWREDPVNYPLYPQTMLNLGSGPAAPNTGDPRYPYGERRQMRLDIRWPENPALPNNFLLVIDMTGVTGWATSPVAGDFNAMTYTSGWLFGDGNSSGYPWSTGTHYAHTWPEGIPHKASSSTPQLARYTASKDHFSDPRMVIPIEYPRASGAQGFDHTITGKVVTPIGESGIPTLKAYFPAFEAPPPPPPPPSTAGSITKVAYGIQQTTDVPWTTTVDMWKIATNDGTGENVIISSDSVHCASPVWGTDVDRIIYQECASRMSGAPTPTTKLCTVKKDGTGRTVIHDTGVTYSGATPNDYQNYCMSPDGEKVALLDANNKLKCVWADGSGDCGGGNLSAGAYGNPQWSPDSEKVYISESPFGIVAIPFAGGTHATIYASNDLDYFWLSNDGTKFASAWFSGAGSIFTIIGINGTPIHQYTASNIPWPNPEHPVNVVWAPDDSFLLIDNQNRSFPGFANQGIGVRTTPDLSDWMMFEPPAESSNRGVVNWTLALVGGEMKVLGAIFDDRDATRGTAIYQWNLDGTQEGFLVPGSWNADIWDRYNVGGMPVCTAYYGTQVVDI